MREGWELKRLGDICNFVRGPFGGSLKKSCFKDSGHAVYEQQHAIYNQFSQIRYFIDDEKFEEMKRFELLSGDLIMSCSGTMGKVAIVPSNIKRGVINQALLKLTPSKTLDVEYLRYWMISNNFQESLARYTVGAAIKNVASVKILKQIEIPTPEMNEQKQIVALLDKAFTSIDQAKANLEKNIENAKELFQSKLNEIFSQKGDDWEEKKLGDICENLDSKRIPITKNKRICGNIPYYGASGIVDYVSEYIFDEDLLLVSEDGANLLARKYPIAFSISGKNWVNNHAHVLKFQDITSQLFVEYYLNSIKLDNFISGMAQPKLNQTKLKLIPIPFPDIKEQKIIIKKLKSIEEMTKNILQNYTSKIIEFEELKKSILQIAFAGELTRKVGLPTSSV